uniref:Uncharacterized protein n=1 Tax=Microchloropsis salina TaxID=2511165 RepID=A0A023PJD3_9STRA|nr:hypothetical protein NskMp00203 [Microchloropsis salina]
MDTEQRLRFIEFLSRPNRRVFKYTPDMAFLRMNNIRF